MSCTFLIVLFLTALLGLMSLVQPCWASLTVHPEPRSLACSKRFTHN